MPLDVALLVGSLRRGSISKAFANHLRAIAPPELALELVEIGDLPLYNEDLEQDPPPSWRSFRDRIRRADALLFVTPEYNRSVPGVLKNAIDIASRPYGSNAFEGKPGAVLTVSPGAMGGFGANHHLRQSLVFLNVPVMQQPEAYLGSVGDALSETGTPRSAELETFLKGFLAAFSEWAQRAGRKAERSAGHR